jgi:hypothetical protein
MDSSFFWGHLFKYVHCVIPRIQNDNKSEQALQIIGHVVAESYANSVQCMGIDNLWFQTLLCNESYLMNFRRWNYNCAFCYYYLIMEKMYKTNKGIMCLFITKRDASGKQIIKTTVLILFKKKTLKKVFDCGKVYGRFL